MAHSGLLDTLGLTAPPAGRSRGINPLAGGPGPTGPLRKPGDVPRDELKKTLSDAELAKALKDLPVEPLKRVDALADIVLHVGDKIRRDPIVRALRDAIVKIQPIMDDKDAKKKIDKAIDDLVAKGIKAGIKALLEAAAGKVREKTPADGPTMPERDLKERILKSPELPLPIDKPPKLPVNRFRIEGVPKTSKPSKYFDFTVTTPDWFKVDDPSTGAARVAISAKADYAKAKVQATKLRDKKIEAKGKVKMHLAAPDDAGEYVIYVTLGRGGPEETSLEEFTVAK
jgi:hypothetical protein